MCFGPNNRLLIPQMRQINWIQCRNFLSNSCKSEVRRIMNRFGSFSLKRPFPTVKSFLPASRASSPFLACFPCKMAFLDWALFTWTPALAWWGVLLFHGLCLREQEPRSQEARPGSWPPALPLLLAEAFKELELIPAHFSNTQSSAALILQHVLTTLFFWAKFWKCSNSRGLSFGCELESGWLCSPPDNH